MTFAYMIISMVCNYLESIIQYKVEQQYKHLDTDKFFI